MPKFASVIALTGLLLTTPATLVGQQEEPDSATVRAGTRTLQSAVTAMLRNDLRNLVISQETYYADHMTYARALHDMGETYRASAGVTIVLLTSSDTGHSEIAIAERVPGLVCALYVGNAPPPLGSGSEGEVVCRGP